ncbi:LutB/LldF family L-lactate oxidation iron-sulfur protein [Microaerobacter geothermalis]|uniref:LutB/LldF family L-lactate oxidation iron-sulfur protein n=1 Tax=Microaerobacter geothermalis TaxID=674972 RepID=UPI001F485E95|nr:LutB/LldF family L-lactate oxidation iron-sulfur protein [Microaerobacter geothermalis]MCF6092879.1 LutB/LldF family L-lactate oxidation iron-sulfur protein [Microaerobacter geothermalis]
MENKSAFKDRVKIAVQDDYLQKSVQNAQERFRTQREMAMNDLGNFQEWRNRAQEIRAHVIENLDSYLEQLSENVEKNGGYVYFAATKEEAVEYVTQLAKKKQAKSVIKSKSMVSEEIHLNQALEKLDVEVVESDLGEYIIQLAKETPSHIIAPAIHKNRKQIAELFSRVAGETLSDDTKTLTAFARRQLREKFLKADIGISGCNFAIAESGSVVLVTNEGNGRLTTTLPKTHVAIMGMERLVPTWEDLDVLLSLLPRSATGQRITSYVTAITGPRKHEDGDGPEEFHLVIVDNGRSSILGTRYQQVLNCIRCGACLNVCPVYRHIGGHAYGGVYSGPIGAVLTPLLEGIEKWKELPYASSLCGACTDVCPVKIPLHDYLIFLRQDVVDAKLTPFSERMAFKGFGFAAERKAIYDFSVAMAHKVLKPFSNESHIEKGPGPLSDWTDVKDFPLPPKDSFRSWWKEEKGGDKIGK